MAEVVTTDLFKFVAVRPPQLTTSHDTHRSVVHDARAADAAGARALAALGSDLASVPGALARWRELDLAPLAPLVDGHLALTQAYEQQRAGDAPTDGSELLRKAVPGKALEDPKTRQLAWDALYVADSTGGDAGPRLAGPMAALRLMHFAALLNERKHPARNDALDVLQATVALPRAFHQARASASQAQATLPSAVVVDQAVSPRSLQVHSLAQELVATERLLGLVTQAPSGNGAAPQPGATAPHGSWQRSEFSVQTAPTLRAAFGGQLSHSEAVLLDRLQVNDAAPVTVAAQTLRTHLVGLNQQAFALGQDTEFQARLFELTTASGFTPSLAAGIAKVDRGSEGALVAGEEFAKDVHVAGLIKPLGIGDLKVVKQTLLAYVPGEVAHIENVLKGESKERRHRKLDRTETTLFTAEEETRDTERDTQSTDRFELKRETEQTIKEDMSVKAGLTVTGSYGPIVATATGDFAYATAKVDSQKSSSNFAREVVDRSISKVQTKTRTERTTRTLNEVEELNNHGVVNTEPGAAHVIGIYRWVDKRYRAQVYNYGVRLLLEFIVPEPAEFFRATQLARPPQVNATPPLPLVNLAGKPLVAADITEGTYALYAGRYHAAGITPPPAATVFAGMPPLVKEGLALGHSTGMGSEKFLIPEGYALWFYSAAVSFIWGGGPQFTLLVGGDQHTIQSTPAGVGLQMTSAVDGAVGAAGFNGAVPVSVAAYDVTAFTVNVQAVCLLTPQALQRWQVQTLEKIHTAWLALQTAYDQKLAEARAAAGIAMDGRNPAANRRIERTELKKLCITMMTGEHFKRYDAMTEPPAGQKRAAEVDVLEALAEGPIIQFFEQAFEWEQMTWLYFPYFWGRKPNWTEVTGLADPDPMFAQFLAAGAARIVVPVPMAYRSAVEFLLQSPAKDLRQKVWRGGARPTLDDPLYLSIDEELRNQTDDLAGATPEGTPWEFTLPTTLVWLQQDAALPTFN